MRRRLLAVTVCVLAALTSVAEPASASYVGRNGRIAFVRANQIYTITPGGAGQVQLTSNGKNYRPKWSPDGKRIAYIHEASATSKDIWFMNADGTGKSQVTHLGGVSGATWSPDGRQVAFGGAPCSTGPSYPGCAYLETVGTTAPYGTPSVVQGTFDPGTALSDVSSVIGPPAWSPNGRVITYASYSYPDSPDQYLLNYTVGTGVISLQDEIGGSCCGEGRILLPQYSPGGATLITTFTPWNQAATKHYPSRTRTEYGSAVGTKLGDTDATFSPDGNEVAVVNAASGTAYIFIQSSTGTTTRNRLTAGYNPDWQSLH